MLCVPRVGNFYSIGNRNLEVAICQVAQKIPSKKVLLPRIETIEPLGPVRLLQITQWCVFGTKKISENYIQWFSFEIQQSLAYVVNCHF